VDTPSAVLPAATGDVAAHRDRLELWRDPLCGFVFALVGDVKQARAIAQAVVAQASRDVGRGVLPVGADGSDQSMRRWLLGLA
jgi:hypothetical protein